MSSHRRVGRRAPLAGVGTTVLALVLLPLAVLGADWSAAGRVSRLGGARLDSLHQLSAGRDMLHLVHPRIGSGRSDDRVVYQRSGVDGTSWSAERTLFSSTGKLRHVIPNLALDASGRTVVVAWRVRGTDETTLVVRVSRDGGATFAERRTIVSSGHRHGIGVPAVAIGNDVVAVAWTNRANGKINVRVSRNGGSTFRPARTLGRTRLSIDCRKRVSDGLVGLAATDRLLHVAWSHAPRRSCIAGSIRMRSSSDRGSSWKPRRTVTSRRSYGWPELDARGGTVVATVQSPGGGVVVAHSGRNGRRWSDRLLKARRGFSLSAADVVLLPRGRAMITYVQERVRRAKLIDTRLVSRLSPDSGRRFKPARTVVDRARRLRMAPNIASNGGPVIVVYQSGALDGSPRDLWVSRLR